MEACLVQLLQYYVMFASQLAYRHQSGFCTYVLIAICTCLNSTLIGLLC